MSKLEESLDLLATIVKRSRSKALKIAFVNYINEYTESMKQYLSFISMFENIPLPSEEDKYTTHYKCRKKE